MISKYTDIVFDGPPGPESGRFVEVEDHEGRSVSVGEWVEREDGYWVLRLPIAAEQLRGALFPLDDKARGLWDAAYPKHKGHELKARPTIDTSIRATCLTCKENLVITHMQYLEIRAKLGAQTEESG